MNRHFPTTSRHLMALFFAGVALLSNGSWASPKNAEDICAAADAARLAAVEAKYEWTTISPLLKKAVDALQAGDTDMAIALCEEAKLQAEFALQQADREAEYWHRSIPW